MKQKILAVLMIIAVLLCFMPTMAFADANTEGAVSITKTLVSQQPDADGNYTIELTVQGNPITTNVQPNADVVLVVDCSGSMGDPWNSPRIKTAKEAAKKFVDGILTNESGNKLAVIGFSSKGQWGWGSAIDVSTGLSDSKEWLKRNINNMRAGGGTDYTDALKEAQRVLNSRSDKNRPTYVVFISDGAPGLYGESQEDPDYNGANQIRELKNAGVTIYTIGIALGTAPANYLKNMASSEAHFINLSQQNLDAQLSNVLTNWASKINRIPAGTNATMTDVINSDKFDFVSADTGLVYNDENKSLTWNIGEIPEQKQSISFEIKPKDGWTGTENTNTSCELNYTKPDKTAGKATAPSPQITINPTEPTTGTVTINKTVTGLPDDKLPGSFTFKIMNGATEAATVTVTKANDNTYTASTSKALPYGEYTVEEADATVEGYDVTTTSNPVDGKVTVSAENNGAITFTNAYTPKQEPTGTVTINKTVTGSLPNDKLPDNFKFKIMNGETAIDTVTVTKNNNNTYTAGTSKALPYGTYTVMEEGATVDGYACTTTGIETITIGEANKEVTVNVQNDYSIIPPTTGALTVSKSVSGDGADYSKAFTFTVRLALGNEIVPKEVVYGDETFKNGEATFDLRNGESKTISGLPAGMNYTVTESDNEGYTVTVNNTSATSAAGTIAAGSTKTAAFVNYKAGGYVPTPTPDVYPLTITKQVVGLDTVPADYAVNVTVTNRYGTVVRTVALKANETKTIYLSYGEYTLTETAPAVEGYTQSGQTFSENNFTLTYGGKNVTVTNTYTKDAEKPPVDPKPTDPKPTDPATPVEPNKPDENPNGVPKTGDDMPISLAIYGIIAAGALLGIRKAAKRETK